MEQKKVQALFQLQDSYVKDFSLNTLKRLHKNENLNISGQLGFRIINISEEKDHFVGEIELINDLKVSFEDTEFSNIHIAMIGLFTGFKSSSQNISSFEQMLKINGATTLSHLIRAYIYSVTGLSGIPQITTPMINFVEFFNSNEIKSE